MDALQRLRSEYIVQLVARVWLGRKTGTSHLTGSHRVGPEEGKWKERWCEATNTTLGYRSTIAKRRVQMLPSPGQHRPPCLQPEA